jgi:hypothetical protein
VARGRVDARLGEHDWLAFNVGGDYDRTSQEMRSAIELTGRPWGGVEVEGKGTKAALVTGIVDLTISRLRDGERPPTLPGRRPLTKRERWQWALVITFPVLGLAGTLVVALAFSDYSALIPLLIGFPLGAGLMARPLDSRTLRTPPLEILGAHDAAPDPPAAKDGPVWRAKAWLADHPAIGYVAAFILGVASNALANLITG